MSLTATAVVFLFSLGIPGDKPAAETTVSVSMVAVQATNEPRDVREANAGAAKQYGAGLDGATRAALADLPYNTFKKIGEGSARAKLSEEVRLRIDDTYTLCAKPLSQERNGMIRAEVWIEERSADRPDDVRKVLSTKVKAVPGDKVILGGPEMGAGVLVVALTIKG
jgi:hypothetical protein